MPSTRAKPEPVERVEEYAEASESDEPRAPVSSSAMGDTRRRQPSGARSAAYGCTGIGETSPVEEEEGEIAAADDASGIMGGVVRLLR